MNKNNKILCIIISTLLIIILLLYLIINSNYNKEFNKFSYNTAKNKTIKYLDNNIQDLEQIAKSIYENKNSKKNPYKKIKYVSYEFMKDFNFKDKTEYVQFDIDDQGMLGGQYYGLIYSKLDDKDLIIYDEHKETNKGNNIFIRQKVKDNWYFYCDDFDGKLNINKIKK